MNWSRAVRSLYHKEPITGFLLTAGLVDAIIGGTGGYPLLLAIALATMGLAIGVRWKLMSARREPLQSRNQYQSEYQSKYQSRRARFLPDSDAQLVTIDVDARKV